MINRHDEKCASLYSWNKGAACDCGVADLDPHWYRKKLQVLAVVASAFAKCKHYQEFTRRLEKFFKDALPEYVVSIKLAQESYEYPALKIHGNGIRYDDMIQISLYQIRDRNVTWQQDFEKSLNKWARDTNESIAQIAAEDACVAELDALKLQVKQLKDLIAEKYPRPSHDVTKSYPELFK